MRFEQLECFVEAARCKTMRAAADKLHASPQNISKSIKHLEEELDCELFVRTRSGLYLTSVGQEVYSLAADIVSKASCLTALGRDSRPPDHTISGRLRIAASASLSSFAALLIADVAEQYPGIQFSFTERERLDVQKLLTEQPYDILFVSGTPQSLAAYQTPPMQQAYQTHLLKEESLQLVMSRTSELAGRKVIPLKALASLPMVTYAPAEDPVPLAQDILKPYRIKLKQSLVVNNLSLTLQYLCDKNYYNLSCPMCYNFLPAIYQSALTCRPLSVKIPWHHLLLLPQAPQSDAARIFLQTLTRHFHDTLQAV